MAEGNFIVTCLFRMDTVRILWDTLCIDGSAQGSDKTDNDNHNHNER